MPELNFKGKQHVYAHHMTVPYRPLSLDKKRSLLNANSGNAEDNLIIKGDNLHALKSLLPRYAGRVKSIYIDPPYNTGSQAWVYNDRVNSPMMREWLKANSPVDGEDMERHDKWLCMMWPRLQLLKELLSDDGVIFVSIDDHEQHHLRMVMDEVFGGNCFIACIAAVVNLKGSRDNRGFANTHEYVLMYEKNPRLAKLRDLPVLDGDTSDWLEDESGRYKRGANLKYSGENAPREKRPNLFYPIYVSPDGQVAVERQSHSDIEILPTSDNLEVTWRWSRERVKSNPSEIMAIRTGGEWTLFKKQRPQFGMEPTGKPKSTFYSPNYSATTATNLVKLIFENNRVFDYPKSPHFVADLLRIVGVESNDIVLDSFAGSGTTAHAVLALNKEDGGNRKFILVECEDYADTITAERVRRVIQGVPNAKDAKLREGLGGSFRFYTLGKPLDMESMLAGKNLPSYSAMAAWLLHTSSGLSVGEKDLKPLNKEGLFYSGEQTDYYLLYWPDIEYLQGKESMLNEDVAHRIGEANRQRKKKAIVFAPGKYLGQRELTKRGITFCQLPYGIAGV